MLQTVRLAHQPTSARRLLSAGGTAYALRHFCLPSANCLAQLLDQHLQRINLFALWQQVFNEEPRHLAYGNLLDRFLRRVNQTRFPLDEEAIQVTFDEHDDILALSIPYHSYGVPWETESIEDLQWWAQPVAAVAPVISELEGEELGWLIDRDLQPPGYTFIERESGRWPLLREALSCQEP
ncbi:MAG: hypothetical protein JW934_16465, partial [Anaerolineae bacterium]|nr:hypothetical protein [Anaerolineae bacterium]